MDRNKELIELLLKYLMNKCNETEVVTVQKWIDTSAQNAEYFQKVKQAWEAQKLSKKYDPTPEEVKHEWVKVYDRTVGLEKVGHQVLIFNRNNISNWIAKVAAVLVLGFALTYIYNTFLSTGDTAPIQMVQTSASGKQKVILVDGTTVWLNVNSSIQYPEIFDGDIRSVKLHGEAYFEVAENPQKPFIIRSEGMKVEVIGTSFNINNNNPQSGQTVTVSSGKVAVSKWDDPDKDSPIYLEKGDAAIFDKRSDKVIKTKNPDVNFLSWKTGRLTFNNNSLQTTLSILEKHYHVKFNIEEGLEDNYSFNSVLEQEKIEEVIPILEISLGLTFEVTDNDIMVRRQETSP